MERGDLVRVQPHQKVLAYGVVLKVKYRVYDPPKNGLIAEWRVLVHTEDFERKWYSANWVFRDNRT